MPFVRSAKWQESNKKGKNKMSIVNEYVKKETVKETVEGNKTSTEDIIKNVVVEQLGVNFDQVRNDASFIDDLDADELDMVELVIFLEEEFGLGITDEEAENIKTVQDVIDLIRSKGIHD